MFVLIISVSGHCLSLYFNILLKKFLVKMGTLRMQN